MSNNRFLEEIQEAINNKDYLAGINKLLKLRESLLLLGKETKDTDELTSIVTQIKRVDEVISKLKTKLKPDVEVQYEQKDIDERDSFNVELDFKERIQDFKNLIMDLLFQKSMNDYEKIVVVLGLKETGRSIFFHNLAINSGYEATIVDITKVLSHEESLENLVKRISSANLSSSFVVLDGLDGDVCNSENKSTIHGILDPIISLVKDKNVPVFIITNDAKSLWEEFIDYHLINDVTLFALPSREEKRKFFLDFGVQDDLDLALENTERFTPKELKELVIKHSESGFDWNNYPFYSKRYSASDEDELVAHVEEFSRIKESQIVVENPIADLINDIHIANEKVFMASTDEDVVVMQEPEVLFEESNNVLTIPEEDTLIDRQENIDLIEKVLSEYNISYEEIDFVEGLAYTRYKVRLAKGERIQKVTKSSDEIKMRLRSSNVRIVAPIDKEDAIGIELPNTSRKSLLFGEICKPYPILEIPVGRDINNNSVFVNFSKDPHYLIGGSTGSGKSVNLNVFISYILLMRKPDDVELLLVDPKRVEFSIYSDLPHSITSRPINELDEIKSAFNYLVEVMEERYKTFENKELRNISEYNERYSPKLPYIFVIVDEFATISDDEEVMDQIQRLSQLARAAGIHILLATQRPSTDIVKGTIKNNFTGRIAFKVSSNHDSKTTIYESGAEDLIGRGDMLIANSGETVTRAQGAYIGLDEIKKIIKLAQQKYGPNLQIKRSFKELL